MNVKGEPVDKGGKCTTERKSPRPRTVTILPSKTCTTGTILKSIGIAVVEDDSWAWVLRKRTVDEKVIGSVTEGTMSIGAVVGQVGKTSAESAIVSDTAVLWMAGSSLATTGALIFRTVDTEMACGMTLKTMSRRICIGLWAQAGIVRCNLCRIGGRAALVKGRSNVSGDVRRDIK